MNAARRYILLSALLGLGFIVGSQLGAAAAQTTGDHVLTGELVVTNAGRNQFRLVGHGGSFAAPAGTAVEELDGKPVQVAIGRGGHVLRITEVPVQVDRVTHSEEVVSGLFVMRDPVARTFSFASDDHVYIAPPDVDIRQYSGHMVDVHLNEHGQVTEIGFAKHSLSGPGFVTHA